MEEFTFEQRPDLLAAPVLDALRAGSLDVALVEIAPTLADTAEFCTRYGFTMDQSANCVIVAGKRGDVVRYAACVVLATTRADVN